MTTRKPPLRAVRRDGSQWLTAESCASLRSVILPLPPLGVLPYDSVFTWITSVYQGQVVIAKSTMAECIKSLLWIVARSDQSRVGGQIWDRGWKQLRRDIALMGPILGQVPNFDPGYQYMPWDRTKYPSSNFGIVYNTLAQNLGCYITYQHWWDVLQYTSTYPRIVQRKKKALNFPLLREANDICLI